MKKENGAVRFELNVSDFFYLFQLKGRMWIGNRLMLSFIYLVHNLHFLTSSESQVIWAAKWCNLKKKHD